MQPAGQQQAVQVARTGVRMVPASGGISPLQFLGRLKVGRAGGADGASIQVGSLILDTGANANVLGMEATIVDGVSVANLLQSLRIKHFPCDKVIESVNGAVTHLYETEPLTLTMPGGQMVRNVKFLVVPNSRDMIIGLPTLAEMFFELSCKPGGVIEAWVGHGAWRHQLHVGGGRGPLASEMGGTGAVLFRVQAEYATSLASEVARSCPGPSALIGAAGRSDG